MPNLNSIVSHLSRLNEEGLACEDSHSSNFWSQKVISFLRTAVGETEAAEFLRLSSEDDWEKHALRLGLIQGLVALAEAENQTTGATSTASVIPGRSTQSIPDSNRVFVVHGHDNETKETTARFLERLELLPIILHEQPSGGRTIIEKFEKFSGTAAFAVVLLTPDDVGATASTRTIMLPRARQNVVLELGYFMGRLGRDRVCALYKGGVDLPSDYQGVIYIEIDASGAWKAKLAQELVQAKMPINLAGLLG